MSNRIEITVDGRPAQVEQGAMLLGALHELGVEIPTLCNHPSLEPNGACRLCVVEITRQSWNGWSKLVTSCLYPAEDGLVVFTHSARVREARRTLLGLYLARSPHSAELKALARNEGVDETPFPVIEDGDNCIMCGLCIRVCQELGPEALAPLGRGAEKAVGPRPDGFGEDCTGCRACAEICPTRAIPSTLKDGTLEIWQRKFELPLCSVTPEHCRACGVCEEVCPHDIPRVALYRNGLSVSKIAHDNCTGCGLCAGACPTGAITQRDGEYGGDGRVQGDWPLSAKTVAFACSRSPKPEGEAGWVPVSCVGRVPIESMLEALARGADGVALVCRDRGSCPDCRGGELGEKRAALAEELAAAAGLGEGRVGYLHHLVGHDGPARAVELFRADLGSTPLLEVIPETETPMTGSDRALEIMDWLAVQASLNPELPRSLAPMFEGKTTEESDTVLYLGSLPWLDLLLKPLVGEWRLRELVGDAVKLLDEKGFAYRPVLATRQEVDLDATKAIVFDSALLGELPDGIEAVTLDQAAGTRPPEDNDGADDGFRFRVSPKERLALIESLRNAAGPPICETAGQLAQYMLLRRMGSWQTGFSAEPRMAFQAAESPGVRTAPPTEGKTDRRLTAHPILPPLGPADVDFTFNGKPLKARTGEVISSALYAAGISVFGHHHRDSGPQSVFCVNGQCSQCTVVADGRPVKSCMAPVTPGMKVKSIDGSLPVLEDAEPSATTHDVDDVEVQVIVIGGGPAGICAAIELGRLGVGVLIVDDKQELGGKLSLQTHNFFGSVADCYARTRGVDIGHLLADQVAALPTLKVWLDATVVGVYNDGKFGVAGPDGYRLVTPQTVLVAAGAREKSLSFPGCDLPGVYGAGAFQTLVNRDQVSCAEKLFIIGGGNVGLIGAYHALQAGIDVVGLVEALPRCGGYKVHEDKIRRLGVPVWTRHTVLRVEGKETAEKVVIAAIDDRFKPIPGTERSFEVDTVLIAVGLSPVDELLQKARQYGMKVYSAGDAEEIAEASAAIFSGKITGRRIARDLGMDVPIPSNWESFGELLKHRPTEPAKFDPKDSFAAVLPLIRCVQEIPCDPCIEACPKGLISMEHSILDLPKFEGSCMGCGECVLACPGLAINLLIQDYDPSGKTVLLMLPFEFVNNQIPLGQTVTTTGLVGDVVGQGRVIAVREGATQDRRKLLMLEMPVGDKLKVAGFQIRDPWPGDPVTDTVEDEDPIVCRCERVRKSEIVREIRAGVRDMNQLKAVVRSGMGGCGSKTCSGLIQRLFIEEGVPLSEVTLPSQRPLVAEVHLGDFVKSAQQGEDQR
jgi:NAD-dependent dihydropyrimidine dehydrogenase PreA subunit/thioredoxin reductase/coenzyme F420-reducing hydrogenase delta subunit/aerobic-type carbon monoxide dehydrogenase small subunit (CoxS/CutS family)